MSKSDKQMDYLFPEEEIQQPKVERKKKDPARDPAGRFTTKAMMEEFNKLKIQISTLIRQRQSVYRQLRQKDEEIIRLKQIINGSKF